MALLALQEMTKPETSFVSPNQNDHAFHKKKDHSSNYKMMRLFSESLPSQTRRDTDDVTKLAMQLRGFYVFWLHTKSAE